MGLLERLNVEFDGEDEETLRQFRTKAGYKKGSLKIALIQAMLLYLQQKPPKFGSKSRLEGGKL